MNTGSKKRKQAHDQEGHTKREIRLKERGEKYQETKEERR